MDYFYNCTAYQVIITEKEENWFYSVIEEYLNNKWIVILIMNWTDGAV